MNMEKEMITLRKLTAAEGCVLTNGETYAKIVYMPPNEKVKDWWEIPESEIPTETNVEESEVTND